MAKVLFLATILVWTCVAYGACPGQRLLDIPADPAQRGPWAVGVRTVKMTSRNISVDIWYPAEPGSEVGKSFVSYSIRDLYLPPRQAAKIPDEQDPIQVMEAYRDLPLDTRFGPYPVHIHIHGTAAFRSASAHQLTHLASRGFVVVAADHPGLNLGDMMRLGNGQEMDLQKDFYEMLSDLETLQNSDLLFLRSHINTTLLAASGHSAGGNGVAGVGDKAQVVMSLSATGVRAGAALKSVLVLAGEQDGIISYQTSSMGYNVSPSPKRQVGISKAGHLFCTDLCWIGQEHGGLVQIAIDNGIYLAYLFKGLGTDGCGVDNVKNEEAWPAINFAMAAVQEEVLHCNADMAIQLRQIGQRQSHIFEYKEQL